MKKVHLGVIIAGAAVGLAALILTALGNPTNMGFLHRVLSARYFRRGGPAQRGKGAVCPP